MLAAFCLFASCASSTPDAAAPPAEASLTESQLLDDSGKVAATDVGEAGAFADLDAAKKKEESSAPAAAPAAEGDTYYNSIGGETLGRVAFTLYSNKSFAKNLLAKNPDLKGVGKLVADQKVYFDMDSARPEPRYLTKDLLKRYAEPLAERLNSQVAAKGLAKTTAVVNKGESLQDVSMRLYGTHRYWTEIYLVNRDKIQNYDRVPAGLSLSVVDRPASGIAKAEAPAAVARTEMPPPPPPAPKMEVKPLPAVSPSSALIPPPIQENTHEAVAPPPQAAMDPIPETPSAQPAPLPVMEAPKPTPTAVARIEAPENSSNSNLRRILYVVLILGIGGAAFYFTRTPKHPKMDMLDMNADAARPKLTPKDSQKSQIG